MKAWSRPGDNILVEDRTGNQPCQAVCAGVCKCHQLLNYMITDHSMDETKFIEFLQQLRATHPVGKLFIFFDGAGFHKTEAVRDEIEKLNMEYIINVPYCWYYNEAIEKYWALVKQRFRKKLLNKMINDQPRYQDTPLADSVRESILETTTEHIPKYIRRGLDFLREDANEIRKERSLEPFDGYKHS